MIATRTRVVSKVDSVYGSVSHVGAKGTAAYCRAGISSESVGPVSSLLEHHEKAIVV